MCSYTSQQLQVPFRKKKLITASWGRAAGGHDGKGRNTPAQPWRSEAFGETRMRSGTNMFCVQLRRKLSEPLGGCQLRFSIWSLRRRAVGSLSHWIFWLVVCQLNGHSDWRCANQHSVWEGGILCVLCFSLHSIPSFLVFMFCATGTRLVVMSVQDKLIWVLLVMPRCMFSMQLCLSEIVKFRFDSCLHKPRLQFTTQAPPAYCILCERTTYTLLWSRQHVEAVCFNATFLLNGSDKRQQSGRRVVG